MFWTAPVFWRFGNRGEPTESARGLAQSKTLPRDPQVYGPNACEKTKGGSPRTPECYRHLAGRPIGEKHCRQDAGSTLGAPSHLFEVHGLNACQKTKGG